MDTTRQVLEAAGIVEPIVTPEYDTGHLIDVITALEGGFSVRMIGRHMGAGRDVFPIAKVSLPQIDFPPHPGIGRYFEGQSVREGVERFDKLTLGEAGARAFARALELRDQAHAEKLAADIKEAEAALQAAYDNAGLCMQAEASEECGNA